MALSLTDSGAGVQRGVSRELDIMCALKALDPDQVDQDSGIVVEEVDVTNRSRRLTQ